MIQLVDFGKSFGDKELLKGLNEMFDLGKVYGVVGQNGAGKTTLFRCIAGLEKYQGSLLSSISPLKSRLGYLPAEAYFLPKITAEEYIFLMTEARGRKLVDLETRNVFGLPLKEYVEKYSTGMKKKLAITAVLLQDNAYYIFDEPYNGLDFQSSLLFSEIVLKLRHMGKLVLISSHIYATLKDSCDEILWLADGAIRSRVGRADFASLEMHLKDQLLNVDIDGLFK